MQRTQGGRRIQGYLWKEGKNTKRWRRRWFAYVAEKSALAYYEYSDDRKGLGSILLTPTTEVFPDSDNSYRNGRVAAGKQRWIFHIRNRESGAARGKERKGLSSSSSSSSLPLSPSPSLTPTGDSPSSPVGDGAAVAPHVVYHLMAATENEMWFWIAGLQHVKLQGSREQLQTSRFRSTAKEEKEAAAAATALEAGLRSPLPGAKLARISRIMDKERPSMDVLTAFEEHDEELEDLTFEDLSIATTASYMKYQETQRVAAQAFEAGHELDEDQDLARLVALEDALVQGHKELVVARREVKQKDQEIHILHKHLQGYYQELKSTMAKLEEEKHKRRELAIVSGNGGIYVSEDDSDDEEEGEFDRWIDDYDMEKAELVEANSLLRQELRDIKTQLLKENTERMRLQGENKDLRAALVYGERHESDDEDGGGRGGSLFGRRGGAKRRGGTATKAEKTSPSGKGKSAKEESKRSSGGESKGKGGNKGGNPGGGNKGKTSKGEEERAAGRLHASYSSIRQVRGKWGTGREGDIPAPASAAATERDFRTAMRSSTDGSGVNGGLHSPPHLLSSSSDEVLEVKRSRSEQMPPAFWVPDEDAAQCESCGVAFGLITRRHHCRICGRVFCSRCCANWIGTPPERLRACDQCATGCSS